MISVPTFLSGELVAAAVLALWVTARFPTLGPKSFRSAVGVVVVGLGLMQVVPFGITFLLQLPHGAYVALFGCALPGFFGTFLSAAWLLRLLSGSFGGSGGGGGHRVPAPARS
jgi:hypothetical protein